MEGLEHGLQFLGRDADPGVGYGEQHAPRARGVRGRGPDRKAHPALAREFHGVADEIVEDLPHTALVAAKHFRNAGIAGDIPGQPRFQAGRLKGGRDRGQQVGEPKRLVLEVEFARLHPRQVQDVA